MPTEPLDLAPYALPTTSPVEAMMADKPFRTMLMGLAGTSHFAMSAKGIMPEEITGSTGIPDALIADMLLGKPFSMTITQLYQLSKLFGGRLVLQIQYPQPEVKG